MRLPFREIIHERDNSILCPAIAVDMKAADLHNGIRRAAQSIQQSNRPCTNCSRRAPIAPRWQHSLAVRTFTSSSIRRAEDEPSRTSRLEDSIEESDLGKDDTAIAPQSTTPSFRAAPEMDLGDDLVQDGASVLQASTERAGAPVHPRRTTDARPPQRLSRDRNLRSASNPSNLRVVPASPSYFTSRPNFTDHYLEISALYRRHQLLPRDTRSETKITWLALPEYKALIGDEPVAAGRYRELIKMCQQLSRINVHLLPETVTGAIARFMKEEQPRVSFKKASVVDEQGRAYGLGRRKSATARAWIARAKGGQSAVLINGKSLTQYFSRITQRESAIYALAVTERVGDYNVFGIVEGGGNTGQAEALTLAVAKALCVYEPNLTMRLKSGTCPLRTDIMMTLC